MTKTARNTTFTFWAKPNWAKMVKTDKHYRGHYNRALLYAHYELSTTELKRETTRYLKQAGFPEQTQEAVKEIPDIRFNVIGKYYYILNHGGELPDPVMEKLTPYLEEIIESAQQKAAKQAAAAASDAEVAQEPKMTVQDRIKERAKQIACDIDLWADELYSGNVGTAQTVEAFVRLFKESELKAVHMSHLLQCFARAAADIRELPTTEDKQLREGYSYLSKASVKALIQFYDNLDAACNMMRDVAKAERAPKVRKAVSADKLVSKLKYKKEDITLGVASVAPSQMVGSKAIWVYNVKTRKLACYIASELQGPITVKGTSLIGYDELKSITKTLRKPKEQLDQFKKSSKVQLRTFMKNISTVDTPASGRINEDTIILRVDK